MKKTTKEMTKEMTEERAIEILLGGGNETSEEEKKDAIDLAVKCIEKKEQLESDIEYYKELIEQVSSDIALCDAIKADYATFKKELNTNIHKIYKDIDKRIKDLEKIPSWHRVRGLTEARDFIKPRLAKLELETSSEADKFSEKLTERLEEVRGNRETIKHMVG
mgnify:CR=1 FL=1